MTQFHVTVSEDKLIAKLSANYEGSQSRDELVGEVLLLLENKGIIHGVSENMVESAIDSLIEKKYIDEAVVAVGNHPGKENSKGPTFTVPFYSSELIKDRIYLDHDEVIHFYKLCEYIDAPYITKKNEVIGVDELWDNDSSGIDVYGNTVKTYGNNSSIAELGEGIRVDKKNGNVLSLKSGILLIHNRKAIILEVKLEGEIKLDITDDYLTVYMTLFPPSPDNKKLQMSEVYDNLKVLGIMNGIQSDQIEKAFKKLNNKKKPVYDTIIVSGKSPTEGEDEKIKYLVDLSFSGKPHIDDQGKADYFKIHIFENVKKNQPLAKIIPAVPGIDGNDVYGSIINAEPVKNCGIVPGNNVSIHPEKRDVFVANISGHVYLKQNQLVVEKVLKVNGNVDFKTGNINFEGDVDIKGDVPSGFSVRATGSIIVGGTVEDAFLRAEENVIIKEGFVGRGTGRIKAGNNVVVKHVLNQTIMAQNDIMIAGEAVDSKLYAGNEMFVEIKKSWIIGGWAVAGKRLYANAIGNLSGVPTEIFCGTSHFIRKILDEIAIEITLLEEEAATIIEKMRNPEIRDVDLKNDPEYMESLSIQLKEIRNRQDAKHNKLKTFRMMLDHMDVEPQGEVGVRETIFPGVILHIADLKYTITDGMKQVLFYYYEDQIKIRPFN